VLSQVILSWAQRPLEFLPTPRIWNYSDLCTLAQSVVVENEGSGTIGGSRKPRAAALHKQFLETSGIAIWAGDDVCGGWWW
jgi:hypothetical protein